MIRLLLDQGLPRSAVQRLADRDMDVCHVAEIGYSQATGEEITALALEQERIVVTLDSDFHRLLAISGASRPSVIRIRREGLLSRLVLSRHQNAFGDRVYGQPLSGLVLAAQYVARKPRF